MSDDLSVYLDGTFVGALTQTRQGSLGFAYDPAYLALPDTTRCHSHSPCAPERTPTG